MLAILSFLDCRFGNDPEGGNKPECSDCNSELKDTLDFTNIEEKNTPASSRSAKSPSTPSFQKEMKSWQELKAAGVQAVDKSKRNVVTGKNRSSLVAEKSRVNLSTDKSKRNSVTFASTV